MTSHARKICAFSGKRGGFGAYVPLMRLVEADPELELLILLGDMHASAEFGRTADEAQRSFPESSIELIDMGAGRGASPIVRAENLGTCLGEAARVLERHRPDVVLVHGDRAEHLVVALAALTLGMVVAHTQGGDRSGNVDEIQRHAITKLAHVHFPESEAAGERLRRMGEDDWRVHVVGSTYVDRIVNGYYRDPADARRRYGLDGDPYALVIVHPETFLSADENEEVAREVFSAVRASGLRALVTYPCSDPGYDGVLRAVHELEHDAQFVVRANVDNDDYLALMAEAEALVGNSSAALVEAPYFQLPAVNVGDRQDGRERAANVIDTPPAAGSVGGAIARALDPSFRASLGGAELRLGDGRASERIVATLKRLEIDDRLLRKQIAY